MLDGLHRLKRPSVYALPLAGNPVNEPSPSLHALLPLPPIRAEYFGLSSFEERRPRDAAPFRRRVLVFLLLDCARLPLKITVFDLKALL